MTAIGFNIAPQAATRGSLRREEAPAFPWAATSPAVRVCKFALPIGLLGVAGIVAVKIEIWLPHFDY